MARFIQVGDLPDFLDRRHLRRLFEGYAVVRSATVGSHVESGRGTNVGFVEMELDEGSAAALHHRKHGGRVLSVCWSNRKN